MLRLHRDPLLIRWVVETCLVKRSSTTVSGKEEALEQHILDPSVGAGSSAWIDVP